MRRNRVAFSRPPSPVSLLAAIGTPCAPYANTRNHGVIEHLRFCLKRRAGMICEETAFVPARDPVFAPIKRKHWFHSVGDAFVDDKHTVVLKELLEGIADACRNLAINWANNFDPIWCLVRW